MLDDERSYSPRRPSNNAHAKHKCSAKSQCNKMEIECHKVELMYIELMCIAMSQVPDIHKTVKRCFETAQYMETQVCA